MKYKKYTYILVLILMLTVGINNAYAEKCYYQTSDEKTLIYYNSSTRNFNIEARSGVIDNGFLEFIIGDEPLINNGKDFKDASGLLPGTEMTVPAIEKKSCPEFIVYRRYYTIIYTSEGIFGFNDSSLSKEFANASIDIGMTVVRLSKVEEEEYEEALEEVEILSSTPPNSAPSSSDTPIIDGEIVNTDCDELFGEKDNPDSLRYLINEILTYPRIIVPILVIVLGTLDFAKAVISSNEDGMKKAQGTFVKRIIIGVAFFFIPLIVDILMSFADIVWEGLGYSSCGL